MAALKKVYFNYNNGERHIDSDSLVIKGGEFEFSGTMKDTDYNSATLSIGNSRIGMKPDQQLTLFVKKGEHVAVDISTSPSTAKITGSPQSTVYQLMKDSVSAKKNIDEVLNTFKKFIPQYADSKMALRLFFNRFGTGMAQSYPTKLPQISNLFGLFSTRLQESKEGSTYSKYLDAISHLVVGGTLADFTTKTTDGKVIKLSDFRGKYVLVDFWASWCIPCRAEFPHLKKAYARFKNKNFEILGYSLDNDKSLWISALENDDVPWINVSNLIGTRDPIALDYQIHSIPANFLIDPNGKVIAINLRGELVEPELEKFIK